MFPFANNKINATYSTSDTIYDYLSSKSNLKLLKVYSLSKIETANKQGIEPLFDLYIKDIIYDISEKYSTWSPTPENLAQLNIYSWTLLKKKIERALDAILEDPKQKLYNLFNNRTDLTATQETKESTSMERENLNDNFTF